MLDWTLDKDSNPIWLCKAAGVLYPSFLLVAGFVWAVVHKGRNPTDWVIIGWCSSLLLAFWLRYRSGKVASLFEEFLFGSLLTSAVVIFPPTAHHDRNWWSMVVYFGVCFLGAAIKYVRLFYFHPNSKPEQRGIQDGH
jgi:hypothetical protein